LPGVGCGPSRLPRSAHTGAARKVRISGVAPAQFEANEVIQRHEAQRYSEATLTLYRLRFQPRVDRLCGWLESCSVDPYREPISGRSVKHHFEGHTDEISLNKIAEAMAAACGRL
jgi:hypothetical protein